MKHLSLSCLLLLSISGAALAGEADVIAVAATRTGDQIYNFEVRVSHADQGWEHYADRWEILTADGKVLGTRVLAHPHVNEQPFTRSLSGVRIPAGVRQVIVRAHDSVHAFGGTTMSIALD